MPEHLKERTNLKVRGPKTFRPSLLQKLAALIIISKLQA